jgi:hypothetical protein
VVREQAAKAGRGDPDRPTGGCFPSCTWPTPASRPSRTAPTAYRISPIYFGAAGFVPLASEVEGSPQSPAEYVEQYAANGNCCIGTPDDAIAHITDLLDRSGGFGTLLLLGHDWAAPVATYHCRDDVPAPVPGPGQVLVGIRACGICGSDLHFAAHGDDMLALTRQMHGMPVDPGGGVDLEGDVFMGHEFATEVLAAGPDTHPPAGYPDLAADPGVGHRRAPDHLFQHHHRRLRRTDAAVGSPARSAGIRWARPSDLGDPGTALQDPGHAVADQPLRGELSIRPSRSHEAATRQRPAPSR